jgi:long-subunit fatty acid transport protein
VEGRLKATRAIAPSRRNSSSSLEKTAGELYAGGPPAVKRPAICYVEAVLCAATFRLIPALAVALAVGPGAAPAAASPLEDSALGTAVFTGPTHPHATSIYLSPAALGLGLSGHQFHAGGTLHADRVEVDRLLVDPDTGSTSQGPSLGRRALAPSGILAYSYTGPRVSGGISFHTPYADSFAAADDALRYHGVGGLHYQAMMSGAGAFRVTDAFIFGAGLSLAYSWFHLDFDRDTALAAGRDAERGIASNCGGEPCGFEHPAAAQRYELAARTGRFGDLFDTTNVALTISALYRLTEGWWLGASFLQPPGGFGDLALAGPARVTTAPRDGERVLEGHTEISYHLPQSARLGLRGPVLPDYELIFGLEWQNTSRLDRIDLRFIGEGFTGEDVPDWQPRYQGLRDSFRVTAGLEGLPGQPVRLGGRVRVDTGATPRGALTPLQVSGPSAALAGGAELRLAQNLVITAGYDLALHPARTADPSAFDPLAQLDCVDSGYDFDVCEAAREGRALPTAAGRYRRLRHAVGLTIRYDSL